MTPLSAWRVALLGGDEERRAGIRGMLAAVSQRTLTWMEPDSAAELSEAVRHGAELPDCAVLLVSAANHQDLTAMLSGLSGAQGMTVCPVVVAAAGASREEARQALREGAQDYISPDEMEPAGLNRAMENAVVRWQLTRDFRLNTDWQRQTNREAFQIELTDAIRPLSDPQAIKVAAATRLGNYLHASRVSYVETLEGDAVLIETGYVSGVGPIDGVHHLARFGPRLQRDLQAGLNIVSASLPDDPSYTDEEKANYAAVEVAANLSVPLLKDGKLVAILSVHQKKPRQWTQDDIVTVTDVAERTWAAVEHARSEQRLRASQLRLAQMIAIMPSFSAVLRGPQHVFELANQPYYDMVGHGPEILGKPVVEALPEIADQPFPALLDKVFQTGEPFHASGMVARLPRGPGGGLADIVVDFSYLPLREPDGAVSGILVHGLDRTEHFKSAEKLSRQERELRSLADNTPDVLTRFDRQLRHVFVNSVIEKITDKKVHELLGKTNRELSMPEHLCDQWDAAINHVFERGSHSSLDFEWETPNDGLRHYSCRLVPEFNGQGSVESVLGVTHDITHRKAFERQLAEQARRKDEFLATLAHELRNPLAPIRTGLQVLKLAPDSAAAARTLPVMERQLGQMVRLIDDLLDVSRITSGKIVLRLERISLQEVAASAVEASRPLIDAAGHSLVVELPAEPIWLDADATRLSQVFSNLLSNSAKYTRAGGQIWMAATVSGDEVCITVTDNGMGIPEDMLSGVFEMFT